jgi:hypothetical protein
MIGHESTFGHRGNTLVSNSLPVEEPNATEEVPKMKLAIGYATVISIAAVGLMPSGMAQEGIKRIPLGTMDFPAGYQTVKGYALFAAGTCSGRHTHPGIETSYILEGEIILKIDGLPEKHYKAGDPVEIPAGIVHDGCATTDGAAKILTVHVVEKGKPLGSPAP